MKNVYVAPLLICEEYVPDTMIASSGAKNGNAGNNQNCWGCRFKFAEYDPVFKENDCLYLPGTPAYEQSCDNYNPKDYGYTDI